MGQLENNLSLVFMNSLAHSAKADNMHIIRNTHLARHGPAAVVHICMPGYNKPRAPCGKIRVKLNKPWSAFPR